MKSSSIYRALFSACSTILLLVSIMVSSSLVLAEGSKKTVNALYIPLADHYAALVAYERYRDQMQYADFQIEQMKNWDLLRARFRSGEADMAYIMGPLAIDMFSKTPNFRWIGLMHRDGNALAINHLLEQQVALAPQRKDRKPNLSVSSGMKIINQITGHPIEVGVPHLLSTHTVVLYRYLKEHNLNLSFTSHTKAEVIAITVPPQKSPAFLKSKSNRAKAAAFEQSLPWADIVETDGYGRVAWYSKDVMSWESGHVECIAIATDNSIKEKFNAIKEVMHYIHRAGEDIEQARQEEGDALAAIVAIVRKHIPAHTSKAIIASLDKNLRVINYQNLNIDKGGLKQIMDYAVEGNILKNSIDIDDFSDLRFNISTDNAELITTKNKP